MYVILVLKIFVKVTLSLTISCVNTQECGTLYYIAYYVFVYSVAVVQCDMWSVMCKDQQIL